MTSGWAPEAQEYLAVVPRSKGPLSIVRRDAAGLHGRARHAESEPAGETRDVRRETRGAAVCATYAF